MTYLPHTTTLWPCKWIWSKIDSTAETTWDMAIKLNYFAGLWGRLWHCCVTLSHYIPIKNLEELASITRINQTSKTSTVKTIMTKCYVWTFRLMHLPLYISICVNYRLPRVSISQHILFKTNYSKLFNVRDSIPWICVTIIIRLYHSRQ